MSDIFSKQVSLDFSSSDAPTEEVLKNKNQQVALDFGPDEATVEITGDTEELVRPEKKAVDSEAEKDKSIKIFLEALDYLKEQVDDFFDNDRSGDINNLVKVWGRKIVSSATVLEKHFLDIVTLVEDLKNAVEQGNYGEVYRLAEDIQVTVKKQMAGK